MQSIPPMIKILFRSDCNNCCNSDAVNGCLQEKWQKECRRLPMMTLEKKALKTRKIVAV